MPRHPLNQSILIAFDCSRTSCILGWFWDAMGVMDWCALVIEVGGFASTKGPIEDF